MATTCRGLSDSSIQAIAALNSRYSYRVVAIRVDDYHRIAACRKATDEWRAQHDVREAVERIDDDGVFWRRAR